MACGNVHYNCRHAPDRGTCKKEEGHTLSCKCNKCGETFKVG